MRNWIRFYTNEQVDVRNLDEDIRFVNSCKYLTCSLDELIWNLPSERLSYLDNDNYDPRVDISEEDIMWTVKQIKRKKDKHVEKGAAKKIMHR